MSRKQAAGQIDSLSFLIGPLFKKDAEVMKLLLDLSHLWSYEDFLAILTLMKQTKWFDGFSVALNSRFAKETFANRNLQEKFRFVRDILIFPFKIDV